MDTLAHNSTKNNLLVGTNQPSSLLCKTGIPLFAIQLYHLNLGLHIMTQTTPPTVGYFNDLLMLIQC